MKLEQWSLVIQTLAGVAIIATLAILIVEMRANTQELRSANTTAVVQYHNDWRTTVMQSDDLVDVQLKAIAGEELTREEALKWQHLCRNVMWSNVLAYDRYISSGEEERARGPVLDVQRNYSDPTTPGARDCFLNNREAIIRWGYGDFVDAVEAGLQ